MKAFILFLFLPVLAFAEELSLDKLASRQEAFGRTIPQEKVFIHMDNTSYQLGDTIWFSAYLRRTDTGKPSDVSGVLYVELYGQEGYMIERKLIQMKEGRGCGFFALSNLIQYAGFYELRAYTRWQLNWGCFEHKHLNAISERFASKRQEREYYRDYEKLYSRVFPVYDKPVEPGEYNHDMTLRAMRRLYKDDPEKSELHLSLYPEGGNLVEGLPCRVAFEAAFGDGEWAEGWLMYEGDSIPTQNRGRGLFELVPQKGQEKEVLFVNKDGKTAKAKLPKPERTGVSLKVEQTDSGWVATIRHTPDLQDDSLGVSLMCEGKTVGPLPAPPLGECHNPAVLPLISTPPKGERGGGFHSGVYQLTIFDAQGRVYADRLFFNRGREDLKPTLLVESLKEEYQPYEPVRLKVKAPLQTSPRGGRLPASNLPSSSGEGMGVGALSVSLSVRDDYTRDCLYDDANILTEMLLASEIRGFVPQPGWFFEQDDEEHRAALDLLMLTQGWRRFDWRSMAVPGAWDITQPAEKAPILIGSTYRNVFTDMSYVTEEDIKKERDLEDPINEDGRNPMENGIYEVKPMDLPDLFDKKKDKTLEDIGYKRAVNKKEQEKQKELKVHAEIVAVDADMAFTGEVETYRKAFRIQLPPYYGAAVVFISVADTTKWKKKKSYTWIQAEPDNLETDYMFLPAKAKLRRKIFVEPPDYLARVIWPYPRFVKPYSYYQEHLAPQASPNHKPLAPYDENGVGHLREVTVRAKRNSLRRFDDTWPILAIDALEADNMSRDYGLGFMQIMVGDYGVGAPKSDGSIPGEPTFETRDGIGRTRRMLTGNQIPADSIYARKYLDSTHGFDFSPGEAMEYKGTGIWDRYFLYSDYSPRMEGSSQYYGSNEPKTKLVRYPFPDGSRRMTYRDRRYVLEGFAYPAQFYSPDYSNTELPLKEDGRADYRRTLYWNPNLKLNDEGEAEVNFYNNCRTTHLSVDVEGQASDGTLLWNSLNNQ